MSTLCQHIIGCPPIYAQPKP